MISSGLGGLAASIRALFANGEQGVWYDPSDINLTWRYNQFTNTEGVLSTYGPNGGAVSNAATSITGYDNSISVQLDAVNGAYLYRGGSIPVGTALTFSFTVQMDDNGVPNPTGNSYAEGYDFTVIINGNGGYTPTVTSLGNNIYRISTTGVNVAGVGNFGIVKYTNQTSRGFRITAFDLRLATLANANPTYQKITNGVQDYYTYQPLPILYQDYTGTTPVTAVEQPVGLMLDKSQGPVLGPELITNGDFSNGTTGWTTNANNTLSVVSGVAKCVSSVANGAFFGQSFSVVAGKTYKFTYTAISDGTSLPPEAYLSTVLGSSDRLANSGGFAFGNRQFVYYSQYTETIWIWFWGGGSKPVGNYILIDNVSAKALPGNHAYQSTSANRPTLSARYNQLGATENFANTSFWGSAGAYTFSTTDAPDGTNTATRITTTSTAAVNTQNVAATATTGVYTVYLRSGTYNAIALIRNSTTGINLIIAGAATLGSFSNSYGTWVVTDAGNNWRKCVLTATSGITVGDTITLYLGYTNWPGAGYYLDAWHPDYRPANDIYGIIPAYQRVTTSTDYDTVGFPPYLRFNGSSSAMLTNSIDFTGTDKMTVWTGLRKLSDATLGMIAELSSDLGSNNGTFWILNGISNVGGGAAWDFTSKGTTLARAITPTNFASPITNVLTGIGDISAPAVTIKVNGVQQKQTTTTQGTGNYGNYPMYIGARGNSSSLWLNGRLYGLLIRGAQSNAAQIERGETYMNVKTGKIY